MEREFVPYELAVKLKALGFDEPCFLAFDNCSTPMRCSDLRTNEQKFNGVNYNSSTYTSQPTFSQAFRWFREKNFICHVTNDLSNNLQDEVYVYVMTKGYGSLIDRSEEYSTYEEAEQECLKKLIEIVESKS